MDRLPWKRNKYFYDLVPAMLVCTIFTQMKQFVIETLLGLAPAWNLDVHWRVDEIARFPHRTLGRARDPRQSCSPPPLHSYVQPFEAPSPYDEDDLCDF